MTVSGSSASVVPVVRSIAPSRTAPKANATSTFTAVFRNTTRRNPSGDMYSCSRVPHWASRMSSQERSEYATVAISRRKKPTMMPVSESVMACGATARPPKKRSAKKT